MPPIETLAGKVVPQNPTAPVHGTRDGIKNADRMEISTGIAVPQNLTMAMVVPTFAANRNFSGIDNGTQDKFYL
jgi:hypothetical protein